MSKHVKKINPSISKLHIFLNFGLSFKLFKKLWVHQEYITFKIQGQRSNEEKSWKRWMCPNHNVFDISTHSATPPYGPLTMFLPHSTYNVNYSPSSSLNMKKWTSKLWRLLKCHYLGQSLRLVNKNQSFSFYWLCWRTLYPRHNYRLSLNFKLFWLLLQ
jgi:hypothetical protein